MTNHLYTKTAARLTVDEDTFEAEAGITPTSCPTAADKGMASTELTLKYKVTIMHAEYEQDPIYDDEKLRNGTLELGVVLPSGQALYDTTLSVKVLCNKPD